MNTKLYTGTGANQSITGVGFKPDMNWCKTRTSGGYNHVIVDIVRGVSKIIRPNLTNDEDTFTNALTSFNSDGFSLGADTNGEHNKNGDSFVSWNFKAGSAGSANTAGSINSTVSVNTTAGFSIVKWVGTVATPQTIGHGLGSIPKVFIVKNLDRAVSWKMYHHVIGNTKAMTLDTTVAESGADNGFWNNTTPTNAVFSTGNGAGYTTGGIAENYITYCFAEKQGYSKFGSYVGNGNVNGTFIYTGFKPSFILRKRTDDVGAWLMQDNKRPGSNRVVADSLPTDQNVLRANETSAEEYNNELDMLSNGFKLRADNSFGNSSGATYIYMAFAEAPLVGSNGVTAKAR